MAEADPQIAETSSTTGDGASEVSRKNKRRVIMLSVPLALVIGGLGYWYSQQGKVSTDNAYVKLDKVSIAPEVSGPLVAVYVRENEMVKKGQLLFRIDPDPYRVKVAESNAELATAQADVTALAADPAFSGAEVATARQDIALANITLERQRKLWSAASPPRRITMTRFTPPP